VAQLGDVLERVVLDSADGWQERTVHVCGVKLSLFFKDPRLWLEQYFSNPKHRGHFTLFAAPRHRGGERLYSRPEDCEAWLEQQASLPPGACVAGIQVHSDKTRMDNKGNLVWPVNMALLNVHLGRRRGDLETVGFIPVLKISSLPKGLSQLEKRTTTICFYNVCLDTILGPVKQLSRTGVLLRAPCGKQVTAFPRALSFVGDKPEQCLVCCRFDSHTCRGPCSRCGAPPRQLAAVALAFDDRTLQDHIAVVRSIRQQPNPAAALALAKQHSTYPVDMTGMAGFAGQDLPLASPMRIMRYELQHNMELGITRYNVTGIFEFARSLGIRGLVTQLSTTLNYRLRDMPRAPGLRLPTISDFFPKGADVQAREHASVLTVGGSTAAAGGLGRPRLGHRWLAARFPLPFPTPACTAAPTHGPRPSRRPSNHRPAPPTR
jgi:hypothetical protein